MSDIDFDSDRMLQFITELRQTFINNSAQSTLAASQEFDSQMMPLVQARMAEVQREEAANKPTQAQMLMELVLEIEQVVSLVPPRLRRYRELLAAEGLDKSVVHVPAGGPSEGPEGGREGVPGINLADQASLEFHSQLLHLALAIAQDEVQQRLAKQQGTDEL